MVKKNSWKKLIKKAVHRKQNENDEYADDVDDTDSDIDTLSHLNLKVIDFSAFSEEENCEIILGDFFERNTWEKRMEEEDSYHEPSPRKKFVSKPSSSSFVKFPTRKKPKPEEDELTPHCLPDTPSSLFDQPPGPPPPEIKRPPLPKTMIKKFLSKVDNSKASTPHIVIDTELEEPSSDGPICYSDEGDENTIAEVFIDRYRSLSSRDGEDSLLSQPLPDDYKKDYHIASNNEAMALIDTPVPPPPKSKYSTFPKKNPLHSLKSKYKSSTSSLPIIGEDQEKIVIDTVEDTVSEHINSHGNKFNRNNMDIPFGPESEEKSENRIPISRLLPSSSASVMQRSYAGSRATRSRAKPFRELNNTNSVRNSSFSVAQNSLATQSQFHITNNNAHISKMVQTMNNVLLEGHCTVSETVRSNLRQITVPPGDLQIKLKRFGGAGTSSLVVDKIGPTSAVCSKLTAGDMIIAVNKTDVSNLPAKHVMGLLSDTNNSGIRTLLFQPKSTFQNAF